MNPEKAYPLFWPVGWPRTQFPGKSKFGNRSVHAAMQGLTHELDLLKASGMFVSSNVTLGNPSPKDKGVCVYFKLKGKDYALPCDKWDCVEDNLWALACHIESLRGQDRWGVSTIERAFAGYIALPAPSGSNPEEWWTILKVDRTAEFEAVQTAYFDQAKLCHPDNGGSNEKMTLVNAAWAAAKKTLRIRE